MHRQRQCVLGQRNSKVIISALDNDRFDIKDGYFIIFFIKLTVEVNFKRWVGFVTQQVWLQFKKQDNKS